MTNMNRLSQRLIAATLIASLVGTANAGLITDRERIDAAPFPPSGWSKGVSFDSRAVVSTRSGWAVNWDRMENMANPQGSPSSPFPVSGRQYDVAFEQRFAIAPSTGPLPDGCPAPRGNWSARGLGGGGGQGALVLLPIIITAVVVVGIASAINEARCKGVE